MAATWAATPRSESAKMFAPLAAEPALVVLSGNTPSGGNDAQTAVRRPPP